MKVEFFVRAESTFGEIDIEMDGELNVDYDKEDVAYAIQEKLLELQDIDIDSGEVPDELELTYGSVQILELHP